MVHKIVLWCLSLSLLLSILIYFLYRGYNWPFGIQGFEALGASSILLLTLLSYLFLDKKTHARAQIEKSTKAGLFIGLLWTAEIAMNNILIPPLPARDIYDDIFWAIIALLIFIISLYSSFKTKKISIGIKAGLWSGFATGIVACLTALILIVFGMHFILNDPLNIAEWSQRGASSHTPSMGVYFAYQTLAGAIMHLLILGILMGGVLGLLGGLIGKAFSIISQLNSNWK
jgi:hypothetical protein